MKIAQQGLLVKSPVKGEDMQSPYLAIINKQAMIMARLAAELGFTPSARSRIAIAGSGSTIDQNPLDEFLN